MFPSMKVIIAFIVGAVVIAGLEFVVEGGSLLYSMLFFVAVSQGPIAVAAAADIAGGQWIRPYKQTLFTTRHMILFVLILFAVFLGLGRVHLYEWTHWEHPGQWLNVPFFSLRNLVMLGISWVLANVYVKASLTESKTKNMWALFWLFSYVITQTLVAFDWVMSLEYPWISTLFGAYFFVEAFYCGLAFAAIYTGFRYQHLLETHSGTFKKAMMDMMTMFFGFSIFWGYQFFSQYIVIWYRNIPEEVSFFTRRLDVFGSLLYLIPLILFVIPFWILISRKMKANPKVVMAVGFLVWGGVLLERVFMLGIHMALPPVISAVEFIVASAVFFWVVKSQDDDALVASGEATPT